MLSNKKNKEQMSPESNGFNVLNEGTTVSGDIESNGDIRIDGTLRGKVSTKSKLVLGKSGVIEGDVFATCCDVNGKVEGNIYVKDVLYVKNTGLVNGDIQTGKLVVESGGKFNGKCSMGAPTASMEKAKTENVARPSAESKQGAVA